ncbi:MAG: translation initiation factor IF-2 [Tissierellia bacterium]|nr:translation initiation factor IF-2 [Tissierellia bacterium]
MANKKVRIYTLAKKYEMSAKDMIETLNKEFGLDVKSHMSVIGGEELELIEEYFNEDEKESKSEEKQEKRQKKPKNNRDFENDNIENPKNKKKSKKDKNKDKNKKSNNKKQNNKKEEKKEESGAIEVPDKVTVSEFSRLIGKAPTEVITKLIQLGDMKGLNDVIDFDQAELIAMDFDIEIKKLVELDETERQKQDLDFEDKPRDLKPRPPVVSVMGHVDHGKTSLLDAIRNTHVTRGEAGGITQHIGASVANFNNKKIVFLDTPGHEAFTQMRMRGAQSTDIAILVVAADDGVMPQTIEAINHAKAADIPIIVAINKIDKPEANPQRVLNELTEQGLVPEEWGGDTIVVKVSAKTGEGIDELLEMVLLVAEMKELKANPKRRAVGIIVEAQLDKSRGTVATVLVQKGTLRTGDYVVTGSSSGRVRAMFNFFGKNIKSAGPSMPAQILGLSEVPEAGDHIYSVADEKTAREYADRAKEKKREEHLKEKSNVNLDDLYSNIQEGDLKELNIIVKTDVKGTVDAVSNSFLKLSNDEVKVKVIHAAVGGITESDVLLAQASNAIIIGFNVRPTQGALEQSKEAGIDIRTYNIIYEAIEDIENAIKGMLAPKFKEVVLGRAKVKETFRIPSVGMVAGVIVTNGLINRNSKVRLLRDNVVVFEGNISSLKRFKDDVKTLNNGYEGGIGLEKFNDVKVGDFMEAYELQEIER